VVNAGVGAAWKVAAVEEGSTVAIFGLGAVGLAVRLIVVDIQPQAPGVGYLPLLGGIFIWSKILFFLVQTSFWVYVRAKWPKISFKLG
jgi:hypothetical protein